MAKAKNIKFKIISLSTSDKDDGWVMKIKNPDGIIQAKNGYGISIIIDQDYFADKVQDLENRIEDVKAKPDMFEDYKKTLKSLEDNIDQVDIDRKELAELEISEFSALVNMVDFSKGILTLEIYEDVIGEIIKIRHDVEAFVVNLK